MMTLYDYPRAPSPRRARVFLAEKGVPHDTVIVDLGAQEQLTDDFRAINPHCTVPALRLDSGQVLTDNAAIHAYIESAYPEPPLLGITPEEKADIASWNARIEQDGFAAVAESLRNAAPAMAGRALTGPVDYAQIPALIERGATRFDHFMAMLNGNLADRAFIATDRFSLADISAYVVVDFARVIRRKPGDDHPHLIRWRDRIAARPSMAL